MISSLVNSVIINGTTSQMLRYTGLRNLSSRWQIQKMSPPKVGQRRPELRTRTCTSHAQLPKFRYHTGHSFTEILFKQFEDTLCEKKRLTFYMVVGIDYGSVECVVDTLAAILDLSQEDGPEPEPQKQFSNSVA